MTIEEAAHREVEALKARHAELPPVIARRVQEKVAAGLTQEQAIEVTCRELATEVRQATDPTQPPPPEPVPEPVPEPGSNPKPGKSAGKTNPKP